MLRSPSNPLPKVHSDCLIGRDICQLILSVTVHPLSSCNIISSLLYGEGRGEREELTSKGVNRRCALLYLSNYTRSSTGGGHEVCEREEGTRSLRVGRRRFSFVVLGGSGRFALGVSRKSTLGLVLELGGGGGGGSGGGAARDNLAGRNVCGSGEGRWGRIKTDSNYRFGFGDW